MIREILARVRDYVAGASSLEELEDWFVPATWEINGTQDTEAAKAANQISLRLAEFLNGDWSEQELKDQLAILLTPDLHVYSFAMGASRAITIEVGSTGETQVRELLAA